MRISFTGTGTGTPAVAGETSLYIDNFKHRDGFNVTVSGTFAGTVGLERSLDGGSTWVRLTYVDGSALEWTAGMSTSLPELQHGVRYRPVCTAYTSGTINVDLDR